MNKALKTTDIPKIRSSTKDALVIEPETKLKKKASDPTGTFTFDVAAIKKAEKALEELSVNFEDWINQDIDKLVEARDNFLEDPLSYENSETLFQISHDLKGQATTFGYPLIHQFCTSLCRLIEAYQDKSKIPEILLNQHVDAIKALVREQVKTTNNQKALKLLARLKAVTNECIEHELKRNY